MRELDETDLEILSLLAENARRPFSEIGDAVGLSGPAVSDRVTRLQEADVINGFTIDVNRAHLRAGLPVFVQVAVDAASLADARERACASEFTEHVFTTAEGDLWLYARAETQRVHQWVQGLFDGLTITSYSVTLIDDVEWTPSVDGLEFALTCVECGNTVDSEGETTRIDGDIYHFCCSSCLSRFTDRYRRLDANT